MLGACLVIETTSGPQDVLVKYLCSAFSHSGGFGSRARSQNTNVLFSVDPHPLLWFYLSVVIVFSDRLRHRALFEEMSWNKPNKLDMHLGL